MYLRDIGSALVRRWYLALLSLLATAGLCFGAMTMFPATYQATSSVFFLPPETTVDEGGNPYLQLANLDQVVDVMVRSMNSQSMIDMVKQLAPTATFEVARDYTTSGPILIVTAEDSTPESTMSSLREVTDLIPPTLANLQDTLNIAKQSQITSKELAIDQHTETVRKTQLRVLLVVAAISVIGFALLIALVDSLLLRRARSRTMDPELTVNGRQPAPGRQPAGAAPAPDSVRSRRLGMSRGQAVPTERDQTSTPEESLARRRR